MRSVSDILAQIFRNLWAHKLRSFLTMFGIAWGVGSLLLLVGVGEGFRSGNKREMAEFGKDIMFLFPGRAPAVKGNMTSARSYLLTYQDYLDIRAGGARPQCRAHHFAQRSARGQRICQRQRRNSGNRAAVERDQLSCR